MGTLEYSALVIQYQTNTQRKGIAMWIFIPLMGVISFFNSTFFTSLVTIIGGFLVWLVYKSQKNDYKKDSANIILLEISSAERSLIRVKDNLKSNLLSPDILLMPTDNWEKNKYLFSREFDRDEWDLIGNFYTKCKMFDRAVTYNDSFFQKNEEQVRVNLQKYLAKYSFEYARKIYEEAIPDKKNELQSEFEAMTSLFQRTYNQRQFGSQDTFFYSPLKPINDARLYIESLDGTILQSTIGTKLKKLSGSLETNL